MLLLSKVMIVVIQRRSCCGICVLLLLGLLVLDHLLDMVEQCGCILGMFVLVDIIENGVADAL